MQTTKHRFEQAMVALIQDEIETLVLSVSNGHLESHSDYKFLTGRITGLRTALALIEEANSKVERG